MSHCTVAWLLGAALAAGQSSPISLTLHLDRDRLCVGEPLSGYVLISNDTDEEVSIGRALRLTYGTVRMELRRNGTTVATSKSMSQADLIPGPPRPVPAHGSLKLALQGVMQRDDIALRNSGDYDVVVRIHGMGARRGSDWRYDIQSAPVKIRVSGLGSGYAKYAARLAYYREIMDALEMTPMLHPLRDAAELPSYEDYERAMATVIVYGRSVVAKQYAISGYVTEYDANPTVEEQLRVSLDVAKKHGIGLEFRLWLGKRYEELTGRHLLDKAELLAVPAGQEFVVQ